MTRRAHPQTDCAGVLATTWGSGLFYCSVNRPGDSITVGANPPDMGSKKREEFAEVRRGVLPARPFSEPYRSGPFASLQEPGVLCTQETVISFFSGMDAGRAHSLPGCVVRQSSGLRSLARS